MIHLLDNGSGPVLLCLHGIGGSARSFRGQLDGLSAEYRVIAWDAPGYADSPDPPEPLTAADYADRIAAVLDRVGAEHAVVLGMSWGGVLAAEFALAHPDRVRALVLGDSTRGSGRTVAGAAAMRSRPDELAAFGASEFCLARARRLVADPSQVEAVAAAMAAAIRLPGYGYAAAYMAATDHSGRLAQITAPTLVIYGARDEVTGRPESLAIAESIPDARLVEIPDVGHLANQEAPEAFNAAVTDFLTEVGVTDPE